MHGHGCPWCRKLAGTYDYDDAPADIYRRHDNCSCTVIYECGKEKQDVWTKQKGDTAEERSQKWEKRKVEIADEEAEKKIAREHRDKSVKKIMEYTPMSPKEAGVYYNTNKALIVKYGPEIALRQDGYITNDDILEKIVKNRKTIGLYDRAGRFTPITNRSISNVQEVSLVSYPDVSPEMLKREHCSLLQYAMDNNNSEEVSFSLSYNFSLKNIVKGEMSSTDTNVYGLGNRVFVMHNHPKNGGYSIKDIKFYMDNDIVGALSIVKNNGGIEIIEKTRVWE